VDNLDRMFRHLVRTIRSRFPQYLDQPWSWEKARSVAQHLWIPVLVIGTSGTAAMIRDY